MNNGTKNKLNNTNRGGTTKTNKQLNYQNK